MIVSSIGMAPLYLPINERFIQAFEFIKNVDLFSLEAGRYDIDGDNIYMIVAEDLQMKNPQEAKLEVHNKYIDIQFPLTAEEGFGWSHRNDCQEISKPMDEQNDIMFYDDQASSYVKLHPGQFVIFFPFDAHAPLIGEGKIKKCVIKVLI